MTRAADRTYPIVLFLVPWPCMPRDRITGIAIIVTTVLGKFLRPSTSLLSRKRRRLSRPASRARMRFRPRPRGMALHSCYLPSRAVPRVGGDLSARILAILLLPMCTPSVLMHPRRGIRVAVIRREAYTVLIVIPRHEGHTSLVCAHHTPARPRSLIMLLRSCRILPTCRTLRAVASRPPDRGRLRGLLWIMEGPRLRIFSSSRWI